MTTVEFAKNLSWAIQCITFSNGWNLEKDMTLSQKLQLISAVKSWLDDRVQEIESEVEAQAEAEQNRAAEQP